MAQMDLFEKAPSKGMSVVQDTAYHSASTGQQELVNWLPLLGSADGDWLRDRNRSISRVRDLARNDGHARSGIKKKTDHEVGWKLRLSAKPNHRALGIDSDAAIKLGQAIEAEWSLFADDPFKRCDVTRKQNMGGIQRLLDKELNTTQECLAMLDWKSDRGARYATCVRVIDPDRLSNPNDGMDTDKLRGGVEHDDDGVPVLYHIRKAHPGDWMQIGLQAFTWEAVPKEQPWGRPIIIHAFEPDRPDQSRGVPDLVSVISRFKMLGKFADAELASATVNALFAAFVKSGLDPATVAETLTPTEVLNAGNQRLDYYKESPVTVGGTRIPVLPLGDEIQMNNSPRQTGDFASFQGAFLQTIAAAMGLSYEQLSMDWSKTNYSSARAALNEVWRSVRAKVEFFSEHVMLPIYIAFLEEAFDKGYLVEPAGAPLFHDMPAAYARAKWIGPARGWVDPVKEAQGAQMRIETFTSTLEQECAEQGLDYLDVLDQRAREKAEMELRGLSTDVQAIMTVQPATDRPEERPAP